MALTENPYAEHYAVPLIANSKLGATDGWYNHGFEILQLAGVGKPAHASDHQIVGTYLVRRSSSTRKTSAAGPSRTQRKGELNERACII